MCCVTGICHQRGSPQVSLGHGLPSVSKRVGMRILTGEYVDCADLPPAKGKVKSLPALEGSVIIMQAYDLLQQKRLIPDLTSWMQGFAILLIVICSQSPGHLNDLIGYMCNIVKASHRYKWPLWVIYDQNFRLDVAASGTTVWAHVDPGLDAQCFTG